MRRGAIIAGAAVLVGISGLVLAALVVPTEIQQPGTQPGQVGNLETPDKCDNCHGGYSTAVEPAYNWRGSMMANATRDPLFWATVAVAEQDFDGVGDLCIRCHSTSGWLKGRSTPTDGSALTASDADGVDCDFCHKVTNPDNSELVGVMTAPFIANNEATPAVGYYGSGMASVWGGNEKLGPYADADARHQFGQSRFHRSVDFCGTCHDVSNAAVGDLAHNNGAQVPLAAGTFSGALGSAVNGKAAFNNFPFAYGIVERTYSEYKSGALSSTLVSSYGSLPGDLKHGAIKTAYERSIVAGTGGNYADNTARFFSCQTCHMAAVTGQGCNKNPPVRKDLPLHDMTGGNYWIGDAMQYLDVQGRLRVGGGLSDGQKAAMNAGKLRAQAQLREALSLSVSGNALKVVNLTGHKLISGYPEGRRMWLNVKWYDLGGNLLREDGKYGPMNVLIDGVTAQVNTILDLSAPNTRIYEAHYAMTQQWANQLLALGYSRSLPLSFDRTSGAVDYTLGQLADQAPGTYHETFHFVLNNSVAKDNRIPPYGMSYNEAQKRNALPVPASQYGDPGPGGVYNYWDELTLNPPAGAVNATIDMMYQPTSWEYIQFLHLANNRSNAFLANEGAYLLEAWRATGMAAPYAMASATWSAPPPPADTTPPAIVSADFDYMTPQHKLVVRFSESVQGTLGGDDVQVVDLSNVPATSVAAVLSNYDALTNTATFDLSPAMLPNGNYRATFLADGIKDAAGNKLDGDANGSAGGDYVYDFFFLNGDANRDRSVDVSDLGILGMNWQQSPRGWAEGDFNCDGTVDVTDLGILGMSWQITLPLPSGSAIAPAGQLLVEEPTASAAKHGPSAKRR